MYDDKRHNSIISDIGYHDYIALLCYTDAEWTRREAVDGKEQNQRIFFQGFNQIIKKCCKYRNDIKRNHKLFNEANKKKMAKEEEISPYLFNPICYMPFGYADELSIILFDDFDPIHYLTADIETTEEDVCLAFCPKMKDIIPVGSDNLFCELHELLGGENAKEPETIDGKYIPAAHEFMKQTPLLSFTKYKIHGLGALGQGLLFQNALFEAMSQRIKRVYDQLLKEVENGKMWYRWANLDDVKSAKVTFLDLQGSEEIGILTFCRNYSVALSFVEAMRNITFKDVFNANKNGYLEPALYHSKMHKSVIRHALELRKEAPSEDIKLLEDEHAFRWTLSSLGISAITFFNEEYSTYNGYVNAMAKVKIPPGHLKNFGKEVVMKVAMGEKIPPPEAEAYETMCGYVIGEDDIFFRYGSDKKAFELPLVSLKEVVTVLRKNYELFGLHRTKAGRDVIDISTILTIPLLSLKDESCGKTEELIFKGRGEKHFSPLLELLREIQKRLCYSVGNQALPPTAGRLDLDSLKRGHKYYGLPISLRRTIEYLYQNFAVTIADPALFDVVLDLYDMFLTLHVTLTKYLPKQLNDKNEPKRIGKDLLLLEGERVEQIGMLVDAIHNALSHRIQKLYPEYHVRDIAIDFRGGLNQILFAVDAPIKCGLGLMRRYVLGPDRGYDAIGVLARVSFRPDARCCSLRLKTEKEAQLAYYEVDVPHMLHIATYYDYLHEAFHLIFDALYLRGRFDNDMNPVMRDRMSEIFTILLQQILVFGSDTKSAMFNFIVSYSKSLTSIGVDDEDTIIRFTELLIRLFAVIDAVEGAKEIRIEDDPIRWSKQGWPRIGESIDNVLERFKKMVSVVGPFFTEYKRLWEMGHKNGWLDGGAYCWDQFRDIYPSVQERMPKIWSEAVGIFQRYVKCSRWSEEDGYKYTDDEVLKMVDSGMKSGKPLIRWQFGVYRDRATEQDENMDGELDALFLVCKIFRSYISRIKNAENKEIHLCRDKNREVVYPKKSKCDWFEFQYDRGAASMFCPVPIERRKRLQRQITAMKSLWDISSGLRARRLSKILSDNFSEIGLR